MRFSGRKTPESHISDAYLNEWGVAIVSDACRGHKEDPIKLEARGQLTQGGISYLLRWLPYDYETNSEIKFV